jgi:hypothetical protein
MLRKIALLLALALAACTRPDGAKLQPSSVELAVGQTVTLDALRDIPSSPLGYPYYGQQSPGTLEFYGTGAVSAEGTMPLNQNTSEVLVHAIAPGTGIVTYRRNGYDSGVSAAVVDVISCDSGVHVEPIEMTIRAKIHDFVSLSVKASPNHGTYQWYSGKVGDVSQPIFYASYPYYYGFIPQANGLYPFWVRYTTICGSADAAMFVEVGPQRRRVGGKN